METKTAAKKAMQAFVDLYDLHSSLFVHVIEGISDRDAVNRLNTKANHPSWITGSLVEGRYELANVLGNGMRSTFHELFKEHKGIQDTITYPPLADYKKDWELITPVLRKSLLNLSDEQLETIAPFDMGGKVTFYEAITFIIHREAYCIGQIGLWRRLLGYEAMKYQ